MYFYVNIQVMFDVGVGFETMLITTYLIINKYWFKYSAWTW